MNAVEKKFCEDFGLHESHYWELKQRVDKAARYQIQTHNNEQDRKILEWLTKEAMDSVTNYAKGFGIMIRWSDGIYPSFIKGQYDRTMPLN